MNLENSGLEVGDVLRIRSGSFHGLIGIVTGFEYQRPAKRFVDQQQLRQLYQIYVPMGEGSGLNLLVDPAHLERVELSFGLSTPRGSK